MHQSFIKSLGMALGILLMGSTLVLAAGPRMGLARVPDRGLNLERYCRVNFGQGFRAKLLGNTVYDWRCVGAGQKLNMSIDEACWQQYGTRHAAYRDWDDPFSWYCPR